MIRESIINLNLPFEDSAEVCEVEVIITSRILFYCYYFLTLLSYAMGQTKSMLA